MSSTASTDERDQWVLTIVLLEGLRLMRPEKSWRPIVTVDIDNHHSHETILGVDGQAVNQKDCFHFCGVKPSSNVEIKVWHRSQSKKKAKRRNLVASATHTLGELVKKQEHDSKFEIRLQCRASDSRSTLSSRGRPQKSAALRLKIQPPQDINLTQNDDECDSYATVSVVGSRSDSPSASESSCPSSPAVHPQPDAQRPRRRRGYAVDTDDEVYSSDASCASETKVFVQDDSQSYTYVEEDERLFNDDFAETKQPHATLTIQSGTIQWIAACLLPTYTEKVETPPELNRFETAMATLTMYSELKTACMDSHYDAVFRRLQLEWTYIGGLLVALAAVNTAVFSISPDSIFTVDSYARSAIAASSIASGLGIACDAWFLLRYNWADLQTFKSRSRDVYGSYFFFSLSSRVPAFCMFISAISLMGFLGLVAFEVWPQGVTFVCFLVGIIMTLQFLVYGVHWFGNKVVAGGRASTRHITRAVRSMTL